MPAPPRRPRSNYIDKHVANRVRIRRLALGLTLNDVAEEIGVSYQQVNKYERGADRLGAGRLFALSHALDVPLSWFFDGLQHDEENRSLPYEIDAESLAMSIRLASLRNGEMKRAIKALIEAAE